MTFVADRGEALTVRDAGTWAPVTPAQAFIRPERVELRREAERPGENGLPGTVEQVIFTGSVVTIEVQTLGGRRLLVERPSSVAEALYEAGDKVEVVLPGDALRLLDAGGGVTRVEGGP